MISFQIYSILAIICPLHEAVPVKVFLSSYLYLLCVVSNWSCSPLHFYDAFDLDSTSPRVEYHEHHHSKVWLSSSVFQWSLFQLDQWSYLWHIDTVVFHFPMISISTRSMIMFVSHDTVFMSVRHNLAVFFYTASKDYDLDSGVVLYLSVISSRPT